jgi:MYXO-CTERM domain-containing protein
MKLITLTFAASLLLGAPFVSAQVTPYSNRSDFLSKISVDYSDNFETYATSAVSNITLGPITYSNPEGQLWLLDAKVDWDAAYLNTGYLEWQNPGTMTLTLDHAYNAIGFDFGQFRGQALPFTALIDGKTEVDSTSADSAFAFFGITSDMPFTTITLSADLYPVLDNLVLGSITSTPAGAVPEPSTYGLVGAFALAAIAAGRRGRRALAT